jgi:cytochrome c peroxidase
MFWRISGSLLAALLLLGTAGLAAYGPKPSVSAWRDKYLPPEAVPYPDDNPYSKAKDDLGHMLFFDPLLSGAQSRSCSTCHNPGLSWGDGLPRAVGEGQASMRLRSPTLIDIAWVPVLGWDGKFPDLESVAFVPITGTANMNLPEAALMSRLSAIPGYVQAFDQAFGNGEITRRKVELALATYQRSIVSPEAPFDRWLKGDDLAINAAAKRGFALFNTKGRCAECHDGWAFTDGSFHDIGTAEGDDIGRGRLFPTSKKLRYAFKTPTLRDVGRRAPYMHDGSVPTLGAVVDLYDRGGIARPSRSEKIRPLGLSAQEKQDLVTFLDTLTTPPHPVPVPVLPR